MPDLSDLDFRPGVELCAVRCHYLRLTAANTRQNLRPSQTPLQRALGDRLGGCPISVLAQRFADPALGELVLTDDALGVDPKEDVHAMPGPLGYLGGVDATVQPRGQACMPKVVRTPGQR